MTRNRHCSFKTSCSSTLYAIVQVKNRINSEGELVVTSERTRTQG